MLRALGSRMLVATCAALALLVIGLMFVQYRWSTRVVAADIQREKEHLDSSATLFANEFNALVSQALEFLENTAQPASKSGAPITAIPKLIADVYLVDDLPHAPSEVKRLTRNGVFAPSSRPDWIGGSACAAALIEHPVALVAPLYEIKTEETTESREVHFFKTFRRPDHGCFIARLDESYLQGTLFPQLIQSSFGPTAAAEYEFAVVWKNRSGDRLYGRAGRVDLRKPFFQLTSIPFVLPRRPADSPTRAILVRRIEASVPKRLAGLVDGGIWELQIARKGLPLTTALEHRQTRDLLLTVALELSLLAAIMFLVVSARRMHRLAEQKMRFIAGVSHELRTPVSAISMLARNQADGLVTGPQKIKQYGELMHQQSRRLSEMVEQTLQYAGIHSGLPRPARTRVDAGRLIREVVDARREELSAAGFVLESAVSPDLPFVQGDVELLRTAIDNLLANAQKHAGDGRWIKVSATHSPGSGEIQISVEDRGSGIDPADQVEIFEPFARGRAAIEAQIPGSGLGLSLVRSAAQAHLGRVTLVSEAARGSTFTIHLPV